MPYKFFSLLAAVALVAACETAPMEDSSSSGSGSSASSSSSSVSSNTIEAGSQQDLVVNVGDRVFFDYDRYDLSAEARSVLEKQAAWMQTHGGVTVTVEGHADERGTREYNIALGERRANSAKDYLVALGINPARIRTVSYGEERPVAVGSNDTAWAQNRRSVTVVSGAGS